MAVQFTYDVGYMGVVKVDSKTILATSGSIQIDQTPLFSSGVWGAGWYNAAQQVAYAPNFITLSGSVGYELTKGDVFDTLQAFAFTDRANPNGFDFTILPNGQSGYNGKAWCEGMSFTASQDSLVTGDFSFKSGNVTSCITATGALVGTNAQDHQTQITYTEALSKTGASGGSLPMESFLDVYPFWASGVKVNAASLEDAVEGQQTIQQPDEATTLLPDVMDWNTSYSSQLVLGKLCTNITETIKSQEADYAALGTMTAEGSFTLFAVNKQLDPRKIRQCRSCLIEMGSASAPNEKDKIKYGCVIFTTGSTEIQTGSSFVQTSFNFTALGDGASPVMSLEKASGGAGA